MDLDTLKTRVFDEIIPKGNRRSRVFRLNVNELAARVDTNSGDVQLVLNDLVKEGYFASLGASKYKVTYEGIELYEKGGYSAVLRQRSIQESEAKELAVKNQKLYELLTEKLEKEIDQYSAASERKLMSKQEDFFVSTTAKNKRYHIYTIIAIFIAGLSFFASIYAIAAK